MPQAMKPNQPVATTAAFLEVENNLAPGRHTFTLVVVDDEGNRSAPAKAVVILRPPR
jgi:hypothetical protein